MESIGTAKWVNASSYKGLCIKCGIIWNRMQW